MRNPRFTELFWAFIIALIVSVTLISLGILVDIYKDQRRRETGQAERRSWYLLMLGEQKKCPPVDDRGWVYAGRATHEWDGSLSHTWCYYRKGGTKG